MVISYISKFTTEFISILYCINIFTNYSYELYTDIFSKYDTIEIHITLQSFTISAFERYFPMIRRYMTSGPDVTSRMSRLYIYHTPSVIEQMARIMSPFISHFANRIVYYNKKESDEKLAALFATVPSVENVNEQNQYMGQNT